MSSSENPYLLSAFKKAVWVQVIAFINILLTRDFLVLQGIEKSTASITTEVIFLITTTFYIVSIYKLLKLFTNRRWIHNTIVFCFVTAFIIGTISENLFVDFHLDGKKYYILSVHICYSIGTTIIIYHATIEIFQEEMSVIERLWGSACIYFMIAWAFGGLYDIVCIFDPQALGFAHQLDLSSYLESIAYSISVIGNFNPLYENTSLMIGRLSVLEAVWAHLFVVLVVGRLLAK
jgi:hypothetical protein